MQVSDGNFYGMTNLGGDSGLGVLFQYNPANATFSKKIDFGAPNGRFPLGSLMQKSNGRIYGLTSEGGANDFGTLFEYNPLTFTLTRKYDFFGNNDGSYPMGSLIEANDGFLYGITNKGGAYDAGILFQFNPATNTYSNKFDFNGLTRGCYPHGSLVQATDGNLYGMTYKEGLNNMEVLFKYNPITSNLSNVFDFDGNINGSNPYGSLIQAIDGNLYGMTSGGGSNTYGTLFQYNFNNFTVTKLLDLDGNVSGSNPNGTLIQATDGNLYGMTLNGGMNNKGVLFQFNPITLTFSKKLDFDGINNGSNPFGSFIQASDGNLYGLTAKGGTNDAGILFQYNIITSTFNKKIDFNSTNGKSPNGNLIEVKINDVSIPSCQKSINDISVFHNPNNGSFVIQFKNDGIYTITNDLGQKIQSIILNNANDYTFNVNNLSSGIYFITCFSNEKLIKKR